MTRPRFTPNGHGGESVRVGPLYIVARATDAAVRFDEDRTARTYVYGADRLAEARRLAIDEARKIVAEWSSQLDALAEDCR